MKNLKDSVIDEVSEKLFAASEGVNVCASEGEKL